MKKLLIAAMVTLLGLSFVGASTATANTCGPVGTGTPGYWMNHPEAWPFDEITVGLQTLTKDQAIALMKMPVKGDKSLTMFAAFVAAKLNVMIGNCPPPPPPDCYTLGEVNMWLTNFPVLSGVEASSEAWQYSHGEALYWCLDDYNNGLLPGIPSRDDLE